MIGRRPTSYSQLNLTGAGGTIRKSRRGSGFIQNVSDNWFVHISLPTISISINCRIQKERKERKITGLSNSWQQLSKLHAKKNREMCMFTVCIPRKPLCLSQLNFGFNSFTISPSWLGQQYYFYDKHTILDYFMIWQAWNMFVMI